MSGITKTVLVTGATGGIELAVCGRLAKAGCSLVLTARGTSKLEKLCTELSQNFTAGSCSWIGVDMAQDDSVRQFGKQLHTRHMVLDGVVLMPPQDPPTSDPLPGSDKWREILQKSFVGLLSLLAAAIATMKPDAVNGKRCKVVIISGISSVQVLGRYASSNVLCCAVLSWPRPKRWHLLWKSGGFMSTHFRWVVRSSLDMQRRLTNALPAPVSRSSSAWPRKP